MAGQEAVQALGRLEAARPTGARRRRRARGSTGPAGPRGLRRAARSCRPVAAPRSACPSRRTSTVHSPAGNWVERWTWTSRAVGRRAVELGGQGARRVDDDEVALVEEAGELGEGGVHQRAVGLASPPACGRRHGSCRGTRAARAPRARAEGRRTAGAARAGGPARGCSRPGAVSALMPPLRRAAPRPGSGRSGDRCRSARGTPAPPWPARAGPRCPHRGTRPGAWPCAGHRDRPTRP